MSGEEHSTRTTVLVAGGANLFVAVIKVIAGLLTGSSALLAEAAHSAADTMRGPGSEREILVGYR